ncbi:MAG: hypothetical protein EOM21_18540 [Gammaproteobacteria bacterium]|nr:hypothetical protein [Gammaproteobacteria bacterium]
MTYDINKVAKELINIAEDWLDFSYESEGWDTTTYEIRGGEVWCYFADNSEHRSVNIKTSLGNAQVAFFRPPKIKDLTTQSIKNLPEIIALATEELQKAKDLFAAKSEAEKAAKKEEAIRAMEQRLAELKGEAA